MHNCQYLQQPGFKKEPKVWYHIRCYGISELMHLNLKSKLGCFLKEHKLMWLLKIRFSKATNKCWKWESRPRHMRNIQLLYCPTSPPHSRRTVRRNILIFVKHYLWSLCQNNFGSLCRLVSLLMVGILNTATSVPIPRVPEKAKRCFKSIVIMFFNSTIIFSFYW